VDVHRKLRDKLIAAHNGKPAWSTKVFFHAIRNIEYHATVIAGIFVDEFRDKHLPEWTKQAVFNWEEAMEASMVEVIAEFHC